MYAMAAVASPYLIRPMTVEDIPQVSEIERESFPTMWPQTAYKRELQQNSMARYLVVADAGEEAGAQPVAAKQGSSGGLIRRLFAKPRPQPATPVPPQPLLGFVGLWFMLEECHVVT